MASITTAMRLVKRLAVAGVLLLVLGVSGPVIAGFDEGVAAHDRGDYETAYKEFLPLALAGDVASQSALGVLYHNGQGVPQDHAEAAKWFRKAAEQGNTTAQTNIGIKYANGQGVPQDFVLAHMWFSLAAALGDEQGAMNRDIVAQKLSPAGIAKAQKMAREWKPKK